MTSCFYKCNGATLLLQRAIRGKRLRCGGRHRGPRDVDAHGVSSQNGSGDRVSSDVQSPRPVQRHQKREQSDRVRMSDTRT